MNIFITGGLGFVGRHLSSAFLLKGHRVTRRFAAHPLSDTTGIAAMTC